MEKIKKYDIIIKTETTSNIKKNMSNPENIQMIHQNSQNPIYIPHATQEINGKQITVVWIDDRRWMIGVQVASLLERETYNLYRSMKVKNIEVRRATVEQIDFLLKHDIVRSGTRSITFVSLDQSISFLADELKKLDKKRQKAAIILSGQFKSESKNQQQQQYINEFSETVPSYYPMESYAGYPVCEATPQLNSNSVQNVKMEGMSAPNSPPQYYYSAAAVPSNNYCQGTTPAVGSYSMAPDYSTYPGYSYTPLYSFDRETCSPNALHPQYAQDQMLYIYQP